MLTSINDFLAGTPLIIVTTLLGIGFLLSLWFNYLQRQVIDAQRDVNANESARNQILEELNKELTNSWSALRESVLKGVPVYDCVKCGTVKAARTFEGTSFRDRLELWLRSWMDHKRIYSRRERGLRFGEEAIELLQALDIPKEKVYQLTESIYSKPKGEVAQEVVGSFMALHGVCIVEQLDPREEGERELKAVLDRREQIIAKDKLKVR